MIIGPRLDTPSAVGDEGRPRETSLTIGALVVIALALAVSFAIGDLRLFGGVALFAGLSSAGLALLDRNQLGPTVIGHLCFLPAATLLIVVVGVTQTNFVLSLGIAVALLGVATGWTDVLNRDTLWSVVVSNGLAYLFAIAGLVVFMIGAGVVALGGIFVDAVIQTTDTGFGLLAFLLIVGLDTLTLAIALRFLPITQLTAHDDREAVAQRLSHSRRILRRATVATWGLLVFVLLLLLLPPVRAIVAVSPVAIVIGALTSKFVIYPLLGVAVLATLSAGITSLLRRVASEIYDTNIRLVGALVAGACYDLLVLIAIASSLSLSLGVGVAILGGGILLPLVVYTVLIVLVGTLQIGLLPERVGSPLLIAAGLLCAGIGVALANLPSILVFAAVAGGLVAWDVSAFGTGVTAELGHIPETRRMELYHGAFAVGFGLFGVAVATALDAIRTSVGPTIGTPTTMAIAVVGVLLLLVPLGE